MQRLGSHVPVEHASLFGFVHARAAEDRTALAFGADLLGSGCSPDELADILELALAAIASATCHGFRPEDVELLALAALGHAEHPEFRGEWRDLLSSTVGRPLAGACG